ncbi:MAG: flagellar hook-basal body complex protein FliE [Desulfobulbaceae bacterium]|nr:flagellar hook-basal body complex protein FliE [Pseudomonadota bacterium]MCG2746710.1 flagellar hook-basal body complex protein FliE [Desulfobulbaceae bacterium]
METLPLQPVRFGETPSVAQASKIQHQAGTGFGEVLQKSLDSVNSNLQEADELTRGLAAGEHGNIHETMIAIEKASISFKMATKVQQKAISAYQEIMRLQL